MLCNRFWTWWSAGFVLCTTLLFVIDPAAAFVYLLITATGAWILSHG